MVFYLFYLNLQMAPYSALARSLAWPRSSPSIARTFIDDLSPSPRPPFDPLAFRMLIKPFLLREMIA